jgi:hypothetical protein
LKDKDDDDDDDDDDDEITEGTGIVSSDSKPCPSKNDLLTFYSIALFRI